MDPVGQDAVPSHETLVAQLRRSAVLPVLRSATAADARSHVTTLAAAGLATVELTTTTPGWEEALGAAVREHPDLHIGLGTVRDPDDVRRARDAGARFVVTPWPAPEVRASAHRAGLPMVEGGFTPGELAAAAAGGVAKLFPAQVVGPAYLRAIRPVLPGAAVVPTGGIRLDDVPDWLAAGALTVGVGADLVRALERDPSGAAARLAEIAEYFAGTTA